jgi:hypothetical protein
VSQTRLDFRFLRCQGCDRRKAQTTQSPEENQTFGEAEPRIVGMQIGYPLHNVKDLSFEIRGHMRVHMNPSYEKLSKATGPEFLRGHPVTAYLPMEKTQLAYQTQLAFPDYEREAK